MAASSSFRENMKPMKWYIMGKWTTSLTLDLSDRHLTQLPDEVFELNELPALNLNKNKNIQLSEKLIILTNLKLLSLADCNLETVPAAVMKLTQLETLILSNNMNITLPDEMSSLVNLTTLNLFYCGLESLPPVVLKLSHVHALNLRSNQIETLPAEVEKLTNTKYLDLSHCKLRTLPPEVGRLTQLEWLDLSSNPLQTLPAEVGQLTNVDHLDLSICQLRTLPPEVWRLTQLEWLDLSSNPLQTLPAEVGQLTNVEHLDLSHCQLRTLPPEVGRLTHLEWLDLQCNPLQTLPAEVGQLTNVKHLDLSFCLELHTLPPELGRLAQLERLNLSYNPLQTLPPEVGQLTNVKYLNLSNCELHTLPPEVGRLTQLDWLDLSNNQLQTLPNEIVQLSDLSHLRVWANPLIKPPAEVCSEGITAIRQYFDELELSEEKVSARLKVVVLGEKMAGKTSLVQTLQMGKSTLTRYEDRTHCVEITQWAPDDNITFEVYDFGGHGVYHLTHQFFLTPNAFYLLLVNLETYSCSEQRYTQAVGFWLDTLNARVPGAVVSLVGSKKDRCQTDDIIRKTSDVQERVKEQMALWERLLTQHNKTLESLQKMHKGDSSKSVEDITQQVTHANRLFSQRLRIVGDVHSVSVKPKSRIFSMFSGSSHIKLKWFILETARNTTLFPTLRTILPKTWIDFKQMLYIEGSTRAPEEANESSDESADEPGSNGERSLREKNKQPIEHWVTMSDCARIGQLAGLSSDRLESVLSYLQQVGTILRYSDIPELKDLIFHDPPALLEIFKDLFHHDTKALFATPRFAEFTFSQIKKFESDLSDRGLIQKEVMTHLLPPDINPDIATALMQNFGLCFEIQDEADPSKHSCLYRIPWYLQNEMPSELRAVWPEDVPEEQEQLQLMCDIRGFCPRGLFQRFSVVIHPLVQDRTDWKDGVVAYRQDYPVLVCSKPAADDTYITMATRGRPDQAAEMWGVVHPLLEVLVQLLQEWPGVLYSLHVTCAHCIKARLDNPHQYDLRDRTVDDGRDVRCPRVKRTASISADLVYRPSRLSVGTSRTSLTQMRPSQQNDFYKMTSDPRGLALIISNINFTDQRMNRPGGEKDMDRLRRICEKLKLQQEIREDLTAQEIEAAANDVSRRDHSSYDCFVLFLLTHGDVAGVLGTDGQHVSVDSIVSSFQACKSLVGKPKLFFVQACRGVDMDPGHELTDTTTDEESDTSPAGREASDGAPDQATESPPPPKTAPATSAAGLESPDAGERTLPTTSDRLVMYATVHGHVSWRNANTGTWLIQVLADVITEHAETETLLEMLTRVNAKVADFKTQHQEYKQQPEVTHTLRKKLHFFPQAAVDQNS